MSVGLQAQADKSGRKSPPIVETYTVDDIDITVDYSSPSVKGRELWGVLVPYNSVWRTGANEASKVSLGDNILVEGQFLRKGIYSFFSVPNEETWTIIFNKEADQWGHYKYDESKDALRVEVTPTEGDKFIESMKIEIVANTLQIKWGNLIVPVELGAAVD